MITDISLTEKKAPLKRNKIESNLEESLLLNGPKSKRERLVSGTNLRNSLNNRSLYDSKHTKNLDNSIVNISVDDGDN